MLQREGFVRLYIWQYPEAYFWLTVLSLGWYHVITMVKINCNRSGGGTMLNRVKAVRRPTSLTLEAP